MRGRAGAQPASSAPVLRRGGALSALLRHGSSRRRRGEAMSPEPRKWSADAPSLQHRRSPSARRARKRSGEPTVIIELLRRLFGRKPVPRDAAPPQPAAKAAPPPQPAPKAAQPQPPTAARSISGTSQPPPPP